MSDEPNVGYDRVNIYVLSRVRKVADSKTVPDEKLYT